MTPEFDRRSSVVLGSPYWNMDDIEGDEYQKRLDDFRVLQAAIIKADSYERLNADMKALYDTAEVIALKATKEYEEFVANDDAGWGRFHETWETYERCLTDDGKPITRNTPNSPPPAAPPRP